MLMAFVCELLHPFHDLVFISEDVVEDGRAILGHCGRASRHCQRQTGLRALDMISAIPAFWHSVLGICRLMRRRHEPIAER